MAIFVAFVAGYLWTGDTIRAGNSISGFGILRKSNVAGFSLHTISVFNGRGDMSFDNYFLFGEQM